MAGPWEKYGSAPTADDGPWAKYEGEAAPATKAPTQPAAQQKGTGSAIMDGINAVTTGINRGVVRLAGLPADTVANVVDLLKIAPGMAYTEITGKAAPDFLQPMNRENVGLTGDWLLKQARKTSPGRAVVDPVNPDYEGGYLQAAGGGATAAINPQTRAQLVNQLALGVGGSLASKATYDATGSNAAAITAGMLPLAGQYAAVGLGKRLVRGGEQGRQDMAQRVQDLQNAGVERPTLGLASGNQLIGGLENILQSTPGAVGVMRRSRDAAVNGLENKAASAAAAASDRRGALEAGRDIQSGIGVFRDLFKLNQNRLYGALDSYIPASTPMNVLNTEGALNRLTTTIPGAESTSQRFINGRIRDIKQGFDIDTGLVPRTGPVTVQTPAVMLSAEGNPFSGVGVPNQPYLPPRLASGPQTIQIPGAVLPSARNPFAGAAGLPQRADIELPSRTVQSPARYNGGTSTFSGVGAPVTPSREPVVIPASTATLAQRAGRKSPLDVGGGNQSPMDPELPYDAVKRLRTEVGNELANASLVPDVPTAQWKQLYAGLSNDLKSAAAASGPGGEAAWSRANRFTSAGMGRLDRLKPFAEKDAPEQAFTSLERTLGENVSTLQAVKKSLPEGARGTVAGTVIERLGKARAGAQNESGSAWSPETFLTNWNKMTTSARKELFSGFKNADQVAADVNSVAKAASMMRENSKMWANPSGTGANMAARGTLGLIGGGLFLNPAIAATAAGGVLSSNALARGLTSKWAVDAAMRRNKLSPQLQGAAFAPILSSDLKDEQ